MSAAVSFRAFVLGAVFAVSAAPAAFAGDRFGGYPGVGAVQPGTIVISARQRVLYYVIGDGRAIRYPIAVPKGGKEWSGSAYINGKYTNPDWSPPASVRRDHPGMPTVIPGGSPANPMGVAALTLDRSEIAIHGTSPRMRRSIGTAASYGCIRMLNEDVTDLYSRVSVGTPVVMTN